MRKFSEFFDTVQSWAKENHNIDAQIFMEDWVALSTPDKWQEARDMDFSEGLFFAFAEDMSTFFRERIQGIDGDELWTMTMESGHEFLKALAGIGRQFDLVVQDNDVDVPLSPGDAIIRTSRTFS